MSGKSMEDLLAQSVDLDWLLEVLEKSPKVKFIRIGDGLGTFVSRTSTGWRVLGREDVMACVHTRRWRRLVHALAVAKDAGRRFKEHNE